MNITWLLILVALGAVAIVATVFALVRQRAPVSPPMRSAAPSSATARSTTTRDASPPRSRSRSRTASMHPATASRRR
ncbi:hypothetical protein L332_02015 [Agrococcus pavilionensis RW1]|uniref:Uncharacterized protein n=1 Tax=Agrococcus pavilionensis RW1 TaxID=1330458 RepID=U1L8H6_9MICO|nr:hypothetical protein L332_02015 [Agrococcus pavilionensis RW1]